MTRFLTLEEVLELHSQIIMTTGGSAGVRDFGSLQSAVAQPRMTFDHNDLYPSLEEKAGALAFSLICNHPFVDGNKRIGHAAMETFLVLNGRKIVAPLEDSEKLILNVAIGANSRYDLVSWIRQHIQEF